MKPIIFLKLFLIAIGVILIGVAFSPFVSAETIVVPGGGDNTNPPGDDIPTTDFIECPEGYSCIREQDYGEFISSLKDFTREINERTQFIENVFDRFDEKLRLDEEFITNLTDIATEAQRDRDEIKKDYDVYRAETTIKIEKLDTRVGNSETQVAELRATWVSWLVIALVVAIVSAGFIQAAKPYVYFWWKKVQEWLPIKLS